MKQLIVILTIGLIFLSCKKQREWLDAKRQISDVVPETLADFQAMLDNSMLMNSNYPIIGMLGCDNYYYPDENIAPLNLVNKNAYFWNKDIFGSQNSSDYSSGYNIIATTNIVLDGLKTLSVPTDSTEYNSIRGQALFYRSIIFYELASIFCKPYHSSTAAVDLGLCIRLNPDIFHIEPRSTVQKTYSQIINDLKQAAPLLPVTPVYRTRACKPAAFALLSRTFLLMEDYVNARMYADSALSYFNGLLDFNSEDVSFSMPYRFPGFNGANKEMIFYATGIGNVAILPNETLNVALVDSVFYRSYNDNDLRKSFFYELIEPGKAKFRGTYSGSDRTFSGIASNEVYFIRAECNARIGNVELALADLNKVLTKRYKQGTYSNFVTSDPENALREILDERRKEFPFTGQIRWQDLRRLNRDPRFSKILYRHSLGNTYQLNPNDPKYVYPLPQIEIDEADLQQNER